MDESYLFDNIAAKSWQPRLTMFFIKHTCIPLNTARICQSSNHMPPTFECRRALRKLRINAHTLMIHKSKCLITHGEQVCSRLPATNIEDNFFFFFFFFAGKCVEIQTTKNQMYSPATESIKIARYKKVLRSVLSCSLLMI